MSNTLTAVVPQLLAQGLLCLREFAVMPRLVNRAYESTAGRRGSTIDVPISSALEATQVAPGHEPPQPQDSAPTSVPVALDQWWEADFHLTDKEQLEVMDGVIPMQAAEAVKVLANRVDVDLLTHYKKFYGFHGNAAAGVFRTPFTDSSGNPTNTQDATAIRTILGRQLAPNTDRHIVMDPDCEGAALNIRAFQDLSWGGSMSEILEGKLNRKLGFSWWMDQNALIHTAGTASDGATTVAVDNGAGYAVGVKSVVIDVAAGTKTLVEGDIISFAGHSQTYVVTAGVTLDTSGVAVSIEPGLQAAVVDDEVVTVRKSHTVNLAFHRDAIAFATRPLVMHGAELGVISRSATDPVSGLTLRLEVKHQNRQLRFAYDILYGSAVIRRNFGARLAGAA